jgi:hypothetical protein
MRHIPLLCLPVPLCSSLFCIPVLTPPLFCLPWSILLSRPACPAVPSTILYACLTVPSSFSVLSRRPFLCSVYLNRLSSKYPVCLSTVLSLLCLPVPQFPYSVLSSWSAVRLAVSSACPAPFLCSACLVLSPLLSFSACPIVHAAVLSACPAPFLCSVPCSVLSVCPTAPLTFCLPGIMMHSPLFSLCQSHCTFLCSVCSVCSTLLCSVCLSHCPLLCSVCLSHCPLLCSVCLSHHCPLLCFPNEIMAGGGHNTSILG